MAIFERESCASFRWRIRLDKIGICRRDINDPLKDETDSAADFPKRKIFKFNALIENMTMTTL